MRIFPFVMAFSIGLSGLGAQAPLSVGSDTRTDLHVTVYNSDIGLVKDTRSFSLTRSGRLEVLLEDVASRVQSETVLPLSLTPEIALTVLEQNYEYDLLTPNTLLEKYVGKTIQLVTYNADNQVVERKSGTLLSTNQGPVFQVGKDIHVNHPGHVILPEVPDELVARPSLRWMVEGDKGSHTVQVSYLTSGLSWKADYVLKVNQDATLGDLTGWITVNNESGIAYPDASLKLVAGDVHRVERQPMKRGRRPVLAIMAEGAALPEEEAFMEYHLYTVPWKTTLKENQQKQIKLLSHTGVAVERRYGTTIQQYVIRAPQSGPLELPVNVQVVFQNTDENQMGVPLPKGIVRIYSEDQAGTLQFAGEDRIDHIPKDEEVRLTLGKAFDLVVEARQTGFERSGLARQRLDSAYEVKLRNRKEEGNVTINVYARLFGDWEIREESHEYMKVDAFTVRFPVAVPAGQEVVLTYDVRVTF
jgi:hypothetical protein